VFSMHKSHPGRVIIIKVESLVSEIVKRRKRIKSHPSKRGHNAYNPGTLWNVEVLLKSDCMQWSFCTGVVHYVAAAGDFLCEK
jgi:hypothetical protein